MQFQNPNILFALVALVIPIIIHLFKLRNFKRIAFTNIAFLQKIEIESRKSSQLKKWLTLLARLLLLSCLIFAFARPYFPLESEVNEDAELVVYIDNSFSMQAQGKRGNLLEEAQQEVLGSIAESQRIQLVTNTSLTKDLSGKDLRNAVFEIEFTANSLSLENKLLRAKSAIPKQSQASKIILISDFEGENETELKELISSNPSTSFVQLIAEIKTNSWIEKAAIVGDVFQPEMLIEIKTNALTSESNPKEIVLSISDDNEIFAKNTLTFKGENSKEIQLPLSKTSIQQGKLQIEAEGLLYDKDYYFTLSENTSIQITHLFQNESASFIERIFRTNRFDYQQTEASDFDFSELKQTQLLIIDNFASFSQVQSSLISEFVNRGGYVCIIPSTSIDRTSYSSLLNSLQLTSFQTKVENKTAITNVSTSHPFFEGVFENDFSNFDYPSVETYYSLSSPVKSLLSFANGEAFLFENNNVFVFSGNIHSGNSNLRKSPLVVPIFYQMALQSIGNDRISLEIESGQSIKIPLESTSDKVLKLQKEEQSFIPKQQATNDGILVFADFYPSTAGNFEILFEDTSLGYMSFNYARNQSNTLYFDVSFEAENFFTNPKKWKEELRMQPKMNELWQWFLIFALIFMFAEFLILRFIK